MNDSTTAIEKQQSAAALRRHLKAAKYLRQQANLDPAAARARLSLREWQAGRLARSHRQLLGSPRFGPAASFFISDLYGPKDFSCRDKEVERILPLLIRMLPASALRTLALAVELDALTEELDSAMVAELCRAGQIEHIDEAAYAAAYRAVACRAERQHQIALIRETGQALDRLTKKPLLSSLLKMMRHPAQLAGLGDLHQFLDRGFHAFRGMGSASDFLDAIENKEQQVMSRLFDGVGDPFLIQAQPGNPH